MNTTRVRDIMVPLTEYATVDGDATLYEVVVLLEHYPASMGPTGAAGNEGARQEAVPGRLNRAVLVTGGDGGIVGRITRLDVLRALEPGYGRILDEVHIWAEDGFSREILMRAMQDYGVWDRPLDDICGKAAYKRASEIMYPLSEKELVDGEATLGQAILQLIIGRRQSLLVKRNREIVGVLRLSDVFSKITGRIKACAV
ncbi:MAG: CBS domain-containing protein [Desulfatibacillaceae bacterium]